MLVSGEEAEMEGRLAGRRVVVTDADAFMGPDIVRLFGEEGADLVADTRDLRQHSAAGDLIREADRVDVLMVNLAATYSGSLTEDIQDEELDDLIDRLVRPMHRLVRSVLPQMKARRSGKIIVVGSAAALRGYQGRSSYAAARGAQHAYVRVVGFEAASFGVNINATAQNFVDNPTYFPPEYQATDEFKKRLETVPAKRLSTGREAAQFLLFLASSESDYFFGQVFPYSGGWVV